MYVYTHTYIHIYICMYICISLSLSLIPLSHRERQHATFYVVQCAAAPAVLRLVQILKSQKFSKVTLNSNSIY